MIIYKITNIVNDKIYTGQTVKTVTVRWSEHVSEAIRRNGDGLLGKAIRKYGRENFRVEQIDSASSKEELNKKEQEWIIKLNSHVSKGGYNLAIGGSSRAGWKEDPSKTAIRIAKVQKKIVCIETGEIFDSVKMAADKIGITSTYLVSVLRGRKSSAKNFHFKYLNDENTNDKTEDAISKRKERSQKLFSKGRAVICLSNGKRFESIKEAARDIGVAEINMRKHLEKLRKTCKGLIFTYENQ